MFERNSKLLLALRGDVSFVILCMVVGLALRALQIADFSHSTLLQFPFGADIQEYDAWAKAILSGELLWRKFEIHAPLYPYFLAALYKLCSFDLAAVRFLQSILGLLAGIPLFLMLRDAIGKKAGLLQAAPRIALLLWVVFPLEIQYQTELFSEALLVPLLLLSAWLFHEYEKRQGLPWVAGAGFCAGLAVATHPLAGLFLGFEALLLLYRRNWSACALALALALLPTIPICLYNSHLTGRPAFIQDNGGFNFHLGNNAKADGLCSLRPGPDWDACHQEAAKTAKEHGISKDSLFLQRSLSWIASHPLDWFALTVKKTLYAVNFRELPSSAEFNLVGVTFIERNFWGIFGPFAVFAFLTLWLEFRKPGYGFLPGFKHVLLLALTFWVAQAVFVAAGRYRMPMHPALVALAACSLLELAPLMVSFKRMLEALAVVVVASLLVYAPSPKMNVPLLKAEAESVLAESCFEAGDFAGALKHSDASAPILDKWDRAANLRAKILSHLGRDKEAWDLLGETSKKFPDSHYAFMNLGVMASNKGEAKTAGAFLAKALELSPSDPDVLYNCALLAQRQGDKAKAMELYENCLKASPAHRKALNNLGLLKLLSGDAKEAERLFLLASSLEPANRNLLVNLAAAELELGRPDKALPLLEKVLTVDPGNPGALEIKRRCLH